LQVDFGGETTMLPMIDGAEKYCQAEKILAVKMSVKQMQHTVEQRHINV
jgi:hypothetical protein